VEYEPTDKELEELEALQAQIEHEQAEEGVRAKRRNKKAPVTRQRERKVPCRMNV
jgi:2'-5' RNA ligase